MQKKIIALAIAAAFAAPVAAMADVTVYGSMDGGLRHQTNDAAATGTTDSMKMGQYNTARWGFKAVDDLGDGMKTNVVLETSLAPGGVGQNSDMTPGAPAYPGTGNMNSNNPFGLIFDRQATIGLESGMGKFDMGWNYSTSFKTIVSYDSMGGKFLGVTGATTSAASLRNGGMQVNAKFGDVAVNAEYMMNDAGQSRQSQYGSAGRAVSAAYVSGPINVGAAYTTKEAVISAGYDNAMTHMTAGAGFNYGDGKVTAGYAKKTTKTAVGTAGDTTQTDMWLGASFNMSSKLALAAAYYNRASNTGAAAANDSTAKTMMVSAVYDLSKKTQVYFEVDRAVSNTGATGADDTKAVGTSAGLSTSF